MPAVPASTPAGLVLGREPYEGAGPRFVVARATEELTSRYGVLGPGEIGLRAAMFDPPAGAFLVARLPALPPPVGGVGLRRLGPWHGEVKRLWVDPDWRARGVARALMDALEDTARQLGLRTLELSTGFPQPEAVALYQSSGWERLFVDAAGVPLADWHLRFAKRLD